MSGPQFNEPLEQQDTEWFNPLEQEQCVDVREGDSPRPTRYRVPPGGSKMIPSKYDNVVQRVYNGVIIGGQAPQLIKRNVVGPMDKLAPELDTEAVKKQTAELEAARAVIAQTNAANAAAAAGARAAEADAGIRAKTERTAPVAKKPPEL